MSEGTYISAGFKIFTESDFVLQDIKVMPINIEKIIEKIRVRLFIFPKV